MKPTILFLDTVCPRPYDTATLGLPGQGGTESTVTKVAEGLAATGQFNVVVSQHNRESAGQGLAQYPGSHDIFPTPHYVVCLRDPRSLIRARQKYPRAKLYLWSHDLASKSLIPNLADFTESGCSANIVVSQFHRTQTIETLIPLGYSGGQFKNVVIYNPIDNELDYDASVPYDKNKLCFISSPHKGLEYALQIFQNLKNFNPDFKLHITNPGYYRDHVSDASGVVNLGSVPHAEVVRHLRESLCLFYPNIVFPETFGLVLAESNAVGTPVLTHRMGAAPEVLDMPHVEAIDCRNPRSVIEKVMLWYNGDRPTVRAKKHFRLKRIVNDWIRTLT